jgi:hypothetical protein
MKVIIWLFACVVALAGCASSPDPKTSINSAEYGPHNAGLVVGRTIATNDRWSGNRGLSLDFREVNTGRFYSTSTGLMGYTSFEYFAMWLPAETYRLNGIFAYNGSLGPTDSPLIFSIQTGVATYVGTLVMSWEVPKDIQKLGRPMALKRHAPLRCPMANLNCDGGVPGRSTNSFPVGPPYADVAVFDEGPTFEKELRTAYPNLPDLPLQWGLMK